MVRIPSPPGRPTGKRTPRAAYPHRNRGLKLASFALVAGASMALAGSPALATTLSCGATITKSTALHADLVNCSGDGLLIGSDNITINLNGHTIDGDAITPNSVVLDRGIRLAGHHGVTLTSGTIQEFDGGVLLDAAAGNRLSRLTVMRNAPGRGIDLENHSDHNRIEDNTSTDNGRSGIAMVMSDYNLLRRNSTRDNPLGGIIGFTSSHDRIEHNRSPVGLNDSSSDNLISDNVATGNPAVGISAAGDRNVISGNRIYGNANGMFFDGDHNVIVGNYVSDPIGCQGDPTCGVGISAEGGIENLVAGNVVARTLTEGIRLNAYPGDEGTQPAIGTVIRANLIRDAGSDGIAIATDPGSGGPTVVTNTVLQYNTVTSSGHDGINIASPSTTVTRNLAVHNNNLGIEAVFGVIDGGGNHAFANGDARQCTNLAC
jgi:parallel beta-helix repeat protein